MNHLKWVVKTYSKPTMKHHKLLINLVIFRSAGRKDQGGRVPVHGGQLGAESHQQRAAEGAGTGKFRRKS